MAMDSSAEAPEDQRPPAPEAGADSDPKPVASLQRVHDKFVNQTPRWERVLKAACEEGDVIVSLDGKQVSVKLQALPRYYTLARQAFPQDDYDLCEDIITQIKFGKLTRAEEHMQLLRLRREG